jgi:CrcB protein
MSQLVLVFLGAGLGGVLRHGVNLACARACGTAFPWGTLAVNIVGSLAMGAIVAWLNARAGEGWGPAARLFLTTGLLGGFTTFSAFSLDAVALWERGSPGLALTYVLASVALSLGGFAIGQAAVRGL